MNALALIIGASLFAAGVAMLVLVRLFGGKGIFSYRRDTVTERVYIGMIVVGVLFIGWGAFA